MLLRNDLLQYGESTPSMLRILWISEDGKNAAVFQIGQADSLPKFEKIANLEADLHDLRATLVKPDPFLLTIVNEKALSARAKEIRERAAEIISYLLKSEPELYFPDRRAKLIRDCFTKFGARHKVIYRRSKHHAVRLEKKGLWQPFFHTKWARRLVLSILDLH